MRKIFFLQTAVAFLFLQQLTAQDCVTSAELDNTPGKYLTAAQYPWPAVRAEYYKKMATAADKAMAKQTLTQLEKTEQQSRSTFNLTGGNWEAYYSSEGYVYLANTRLGQYTFQSALYEFFCGKGKLVRNSEYGTVLRMYVNKVPVNTLSKFLNHPFGSSMGGYDFSFQYKDWKNHQYSEPEAQLISLFSYLSCNNKSLIEAINSGEQYFQDIAEKDIRPNTRTHIYRYWFVKKKNLPVLLPVSRKEYLQSLLEYYDREKLHFVKLVAKLNSEKSRSVDAYSNWEADVNDKIAVVRKALSEHDEEWLSKQAMVNTLEDNSKRYKAKLPEKTNYNRFWQFYDNEQKKDPLYQYNPAYFKTVTQGPAKPQFIAVVFRYITMPSSLRLFENFTKNFDFNSLQRMTE